MNAALAVIALFFVVAVALGVLARRGRTMTLEQWSVGGRGFGTAFVFLLMAGEIYTTFTFLGGSGWAYGKGAPAFYIICYGTVAYVISYFVLPIISRYAKAHRLVSEPDYFIHKYDSRALGILVALVGVAALIPYLVLQLEGMGIIVSEASYGRVAPHTAIWIGTLALVAYVVISGLRGSAWTAALKDLAILVVAVFLGIYLPLHFHGGIGAMFREIASARPGFLRLPAHGMGPSWFVSTVLLTALGFYTWPHGFPSIYATTDEDVFRKNAVLLPLYQIVLVFVFFVGFAAVLEVPGLKGPDVDLALFRVSKLAFGPWVLGVIGGAGLLTALVPGSVLLLTTATIVAQNIYREIVPSADDRSVAIVARAMVPVVAAVALWMTLRGGEAIVPLLLMAYNLVTQLFPALVLSLAERPWPTRAGAFAGVVAGEATVAWQTLSGMTIARLFPAAPAWVQDLNIGFVALGVNFVVLIAVSAVGRAGRAVETA